MASPTIHRPSRLTRAAAVTAVVIVAGAAATDQLGGGLFVSLLLILAAFPLVRFGWLLAHPDQRDGAWWLGPTMAALGFLTAAFVVAEAVG